MRSPKPASPRRGCPAAALSLLLLLAPLAGLAQPGDQAVILQYHHVSSSTPPSTSLSPDQFREHMAYLRDTGFQVRRLEEVLTTLREGGSLPDRTAVITFDDGYGNVYEAAYPLLREYGWPFTIFITSGLVGDTPGQYASWAQLREMGENGATLANHTVSHPYLLERAEGESGRQWLARLRREIVDAEAKIEAETGQSHRLLAYPYGEYDPDIQALVRELEFIGIGQHSGPINASSDFTALQRFPFSGIYAAMNTFELKVNSLAFKGVRVDPASPITDGPSPAAEISFAPGPYRLEQFACYNNTTTMSVTPTGAERTFRLATPVENRGRRFRYNCTAPGPEGRYYWYSLDWTNPDIGE